MFGRLEFRFLRVEISILWSRISKIDGLRLFELFFMSLISLYLSFALSCPSPSCIKIERIL